LLCAIVSAGTPVPDKRSRRLRRGDEPEVELDPAEWVEFGGELYWEAGETAGGSTTCRLLEAVGVKVDLGLS